MEQIMIDGNQMVDNYYKPLCMGDKVAALQGVGQYDGIIIGTITRQTPKVIYISGQNDTNVRWGNHAQVHKDKNWRIVKL